MGRCVYCEIDAEDVTGGLCKKSIPCVARKEALDRDVFKKALIVDVIGRLAGSSWPAQAVVDRALDLAVQAERAVFGQKKEDMGSSQKEGEK